MQENLYRVFHKGVKGQRTLYPLNTFLDTAFEKIGKDPDADYYESIYIYTDEHKKQLEQTKSLAGIRGIKIDRIVLDFDDKENPEAAQKDAKTAYMRLCRDFSPESIRIFFSGGKGFHLEVHLDEVMSREQFENLIYHYAGDLTTFDEKVKDEQRLFRFPLTKNKTGLLKIPLIEKELSLLSIEKIKQLAYPNAELDSRFEMMEKYTTTSIPDSLREIMDKPEKKVEAEVVEIPDRPDMSKRRKELSPAKYALEQGFFEEGERNEACMILASTYKYLGYEIDHAYNMIKATLRLRAHRLGHPEYDREELWNTIIKPVYSPTWKGGVYTEEEGLLAKTIERYDLNKLTVQETGLVSLSTIADYFMDFATNIDKNTIKLGIEEIDKKVRVTTSMLVCLLAAPSAGKTSISLGILNTISNNGEKAIFFSLDMGVPQVYQRIIQKHTGDIADVILENYKNKNMEKVNEYNEILAREYKNIKFSFKSGMTTEHFRAAIIHERDTTGVMPKMILIDYLECIQGPFSDPNANKALIATQLKDIANEFGICVFLLVQPTKMTGDPSMELTSYTQIKGSSVLGEAASVVFTMYRPGFSPKTPENDKYLTINVVKNRMGTLSSTDLGWTGLTGNIHSLSPEEKRDLNNLKADIAAAASGGGDPDEMYANKTSGTRKTGNNKYGNGGDLY